MILSGLDYGSILRKRVFSFDYEREPKDAADVIQDIISGQGISYDTSNDTSLGVTIRKPFLPYVYRYDALVEVAEIVGLDFYFTTNKTICVFKAYPDADVPSSGKTIDDSILRHLKFVQDSEAEFKKVYAIGSWNETLPATLDLWAKKEFWLGGTIDDGDQLMKGSRTVKKVMSSTTSEDWHCLFREGGSQGNPQIVESEWQHITFKVLHNIGNLSSLILDLMESDSPTANYWSYDITSLLSSGSWVQIDLTLPSTDPAGWTTTGSPQYINWLRWRATGSANFTGDIQFAELFLYRRIKKTAEAAGGPLMEKLVYEQSIEDPTDLQNFANKELDRVKNGFKSGEATIDGDLEYNSPGYTAILNSTVNGINETVRLDRIEHTIHYKDFKTILGLSSSIRSPSIASYGPVGFTDYLARGRRTSGEKI